MQRLEPSWWWIILGVWIIAGISFALFFFWTEGRSRNPEDRWLNIFVATVVAVGAPIILLYCIGVSCWMLAHGQIPLTRKRIWGKEHETEYVGRESTIVDMIVLRRRFDPSLKGKPRPDQWTMAELWNTPEAIILEIVELVALLKSDGFTEHETIERIEAWRSAFSERPDPPPNTIESYIKYRIECEAPNYPTNHPILLAKTFERARAYADTSMRASKEQESIPTNWLKERIVLIDLDRKLDEIRRLPAGPGLLLAPKRREIARIKLRMRQDDELWVYESPPETWQRLVGRLGIALVREGKTIESLVLAMN